MALSNLSQRQFMVQDEQKGAKESLMIKLKAQYEH